MEILNMDNSININHNLNEIMPTFDGKLFQKKDGEWVEINSTLYKSEKKLPTNDLGNNGDYYAYYIRRTNLIKYSNNFSQSPWKSNELTITKDYDILFPYNYPSSKLIPSTKYSVNWLKYDFFNEYPNDTYYFSIYVLPNELSKLNITFGDNLNNSIKYNYNLLTKEVSKLNTNAENISNTNAGIIETEDDYLRIWISGKFNISNYLQITISVLNNDNEEIFANATETDGLFLNGAQLNINNLYPFINSISYSSYLELNKLYKKINNSWVKIDNHLYFLDEINNKIGNDNDIMCVNSLLELSPFAKFGTSDNLSSPRPEGIIFYSEKEDTYYVKGKKGIYKLMFANPKPNYKHILTASTFSNKTYNDWCPKQISPRDFRFGYNTGSHSNFGADNRASYKRF